MFKKPYPFILTILWCALILVVNPIGDFPLNDDWSYAKDVKTFVEENRLTFDSWGAMTLVVQTLWGTLFCKIFGFSFTVLRFSNLLLSWVAILGCYHLFKESGKSSQIAFWGTLLVIFNPFYFCLSYSYMTEVPFLAFFLWASFFFIKSINSGNTRHIVLATILTVLATLIRQPGLLLPIAFLLVFFLKNKLSFKVISQGILPFIATFSALHLFVTWRRTHYGLSSNFGQVDQLIHNFISGGFFENIADHAHSFFTYWGLFILPLIIFLIPAFWKSTTNLQKLLSVIIALFLSYPYFGYLHTAMLGNVFYNFGMGLNPLPTLTENHPITLDPNAWEKVILIGFISGILLLKWMNIRLFQIVLFLKNKTSVNVNWASVFAFAGIIGYFTFLMLGNHFFDRYTLTIFPFIVLLLLPNQVKSPVGLFIKSLAGVGLILLGAFSVAATHDLLSWNRARWQTIDHSLNNMQISPHQLDGGFEFNHYMGGGTKKHILQEEVDWWTEKDEKYILSHTPGCGYDNKAAFSYIRFIPPRIDSIYLLRNKPLKEFKEINYNAELVKNDSFYLSADSSGQIKRLAIRSSEKSHSGNYSVKLNDENEYAFAMTLENVQPCDKIWATVWRFPAGSPGAIVFQSDNSDQFYHVEFYNVKEKGEDGWEQLSTHITIPADFTDTSIDFFLQNPSNQELWFDDLKIAVIKF